MDREEGPITLSEDVQMAEKNIGLFFILDEHVDLLLLCPNVANKKAGIRVQSTIEDKNLAN